MRTEFELKKRNKLEFFVASVPKVVSTSSCCCQHAEREGGLAPTKLPKLTSTFFCLLSFWLLKPQKGNFVSGKEIGSSLF